MPTLQEELEAKWGTNEVTGTSIEEYEDYKKKLLIFMQRAVSYGFITQDQADNIIFRTESYINQNVPVKDLPYYKEAISPPKADETLISWATTQAKETGRTTEEARQAQMLTQAQQAAGLTEMSKSIFAQTSQADQAMFDLFSKFAEEEAPTGEPPPISDYIKELLETVSPNEQQYLKSILPGVVGEWQAENADVRQAWWRTLQTPIADRIQQRISESTALAQDLLTVYGKDLLQMQQGARQLAQASVEQYGGKYTEQELYNILYPRLKERRGQVADIPKIAASLYADIPALEETGRMQEGVPTAEDPFKTYLSNFPWRQDYLKLSPAARGVSTARFAPPATWRGF